MLDPVLLDLSNHRGAQKARFGGELFPNVIETQFAAFYGFAVLAAMQPEPATSDEIHRFVLTTLAPRSSPQINS